MSRSRVLFVDPSPFHGGGATVSLYRLIKHLDRQWYEPIVLFHKCGPTDHYVIKLQELDVEVLALRNDGADAPIERKRTSNRPARSSWVEQLAAWKRRHRPVEAAYSVWRSGHHFLTVDLPRCLTIARILKEQQIDLVHLNNAVHSHRGGIMAALLVGVPCVCHVRVFDRFEMVDVPLLRSVDYFVYMSRALEAHVQAQWPAAVGSVIYDGLELTDYLRPYDVAAARAEFGLSSDDFIVGNVGRLVGWKGQDVFIRALAEIAHKVPDLKALIVGKPNRGHESYLDELKALAASYGLAQQVIFTGFRLDVPRLLAAMDVVVHSSSRPEPFGLVVIEGMAAGKPVIATQGGGPLDSIEEGVDGLLVPLEDPEAMAQAILSLYNDRERASAMGAKAREKALKLFTVQRFATEIQGKFDFLLESKGA
jgi:glycosyltransferase involved in cell wall biosynthesis